MNAFKGRFGYGQFAKTGHYLVWLLVLTFLLPAPATVAAATGENPANAHVLRRLNSPERAAALEEATRLDAVTREEFARSETAVQAATPKRDEPTQRTVPPFRVHTS